MAQLRFSAVLLILVLLAPGLAAPADARVLQVTKTADTLDGACDHDCSLREAVAAANANTNTSSNTHADTILIPAGLYELTRAGAGDDLNATGDLDLWGNVHLLGAGADQTILDGRHLDRVLHATNHGHVEIAGVTVRNGNALANPRPDLPLLATGGGILGRDVVVWRSWITGNQASWGGGIYSSVTAAVHESTVSGNSAQRSGGGIAALGVTLDNSTVSGNQAEYGGGLIAADGALTVANSTIAGNSARVAGGGLVTSDDGVVVGPQPLVPVGLGFHHSILAGNTALAGPDCLATVVSQGYNLIGSNQGCDVRPGKPDQAGTAAAPLDPQLAPLGFYGGPTPTRVPLDGSPAIDRGSPANATTVSCQGRDQRGRNRPAGARCDIGAVERVETCLTSGATLCLADRFEVTATWTIPGVASGPGRPANLSRDTGTFWFFDPANLELTVKVLDGCGVNGHYWAFVSGLTDLPVTVTVRDTHTGQGARTYTNPAGTPFKTQLDTAAFSCVNTSEPAAAAQANDFETKE